MYFEVLISTRSPFHNRLFTYEGEDSYEVGDAVVVPFGSKQLHGYIFAELNELNHNDQMKVKKIISKNNILPKLSLETMVLVKWMATSKFALYIDCLELFFPPQLKLSREKYNVFSRKYIISLNTYISLPKHAVKQQYALEMLKELVLPIDVKDTHLSSDIIRIFEKKGIISTSSDIGVNDEELKYKKENHKTLNEEQQAAFTEILPNLGTNKTFLIEGATGSGKTETYLQVVYEALKRKEQVIILVPEIALTHQVKKTFVNRFGVDAIAWQNSGLSQKERQEQWHKINTGRAKIVIGTRMAIFAPLTNIGCIVIDEEHDTAYKQENQPSYDAVEIALARAKYHNAITLLVSATPSIQSYARAKIGRYQHIHLKNQATGTKKVGIQVVDMKKEPSRLLNSMISTTLKERMEKTIQSGEQIMLLLNKRGYSQSVQCRKCGHLEVCPTCGVPLALHVNPHKLKCHYCTYETKQTENCSNCSASDRIDVRQGIQKLEEEIMQIFPLQTILRFDRDTLKNSVEQQEGLDRFRNNDAQILIGTQMIAKGFDFPNVTLCAVINADTGLAMQNFRARERQFQLIKQFIGRSGRHKPGVAIIQTHMPENAFFKMIEEHNEVFYSDELRLRKQFDYPPFSKQILITFAGKSDDVIIRAMRFFQKQWNECRVDGTILFGPTPGFLAEIKGNRYAYFILKYHSNNINKPLTNCLSLTKESFSSVRAYVNVDPQSII